MSFLARLKGQVSRQAPAPRGRLLFVLGGASHNWRGPGYELYRAEPVFRACVDPADVLVRETLGFSSTAMFKGEWTPESAEDHRRSDIVSMGLLHLGIVDLWRSRGLGPDGVLGLSLGEVGAAYASAAIDRLTAARIYCTIARNVEARSDPHILLVVKAGADRAIGLCATAPQPLFFAGEPVPGSSALLTPLGHSEQIRTHLRDRVAIMSEHETKWPYHVPTIAFDAEATFADLADMSWKSPDIPVYLASLGAKAPGGHDFGAPHWPPMVAGSYFLAGASRAAFEDGFDLFVNIGTASIGAWVAEAAPAGAVVRYFDATPGGGRAEAWKQPLETVRALRAGRTGMEPPALDLASPDALANPFAAYERLRAAGSVQFLERQNFWIVLGYDTVQSAFADTQGLSNRAYGRVGPVLMAQDQPEHRHVRRLIGSLFSPDEMASHVERIREGAKALIGTEFDLVTDYARPLAQAMALALLRVPPSAAPLFAEAAASFQEKGRDIHAYLDRLDLIAAEAGALPELIARGEGVLTDERGRQLIRFLWMAATETIERVIVRCVLVLLQDLTLRSRIEGDAGLLPAFVDEMLRLYPPELMVPRTTVAPVRLGGIPIPAGQHVMLCLAAANRDPDQFSDPAAIRLDRGAARHLSFGTGIHKCSGTAMSRPIVVAALETLFGCAPRLRPAEPLDELDYYRTITVQTPIRLLVAR